MSNPVQQTREHGRDGSRRVLMLIGPRSSLASTLLSGVWVSFSHVTSKWCAALETYRPPALGDIGGDVLETAVFRLPSSREKDCRRGVSNCDGD